MDHRKLTQDPRYRRLSLRGPVILFVVVLVLIMTLTVFWHVTLVHDYKKLRELAQADETFHWSFIALGSVLFLSIIVLSILLGAQLFGHIRWSQRQSNFIASVSHELNSPLSAIKLFAQTLRNPTMSLEDRLNFVEKILSDVERLKRLIANILRAAEVDNRGEALPVAPQCVELGAYLESYLADAATLGEEHRLVAELRAEAESWAMVDPIMFRQVLDNLVDNAIRYRGDGPPRLTLRVRRTDGVVELSVRDQGIGVPAGELPSLFDRFYQVVDHEGRGGARLRRDAHGGRQGTGIGLFVVRSIIHAHEGEVEARSEGPGHGTEILIRLPRAVPSDLPRGDRASAEPAPESTEKRGAALESHPAR